MPLFIVRQDITKMTTDAIVNPTNHSLSGSGSIDGIIHKTAGDKLKKECEKIGCCQTGNSVITSAYNMPCKYIIHTVGPLWENGQFGEEILLKSCYEKSLELAKKKKLNSIAFPLISSGTFGFPKDKCINIATDAIKNFLQNNDMDIYLVVYDKSSYLISKQLYMDISEYIDDKYIENYRGYNVYYHSGQNLESFIDRYKNYDGFSETLFRLIDKKGMKDVDCYKKANIAKQLFSKLKNPDYHPSKSTVFALAIALELPFYEAKEFIKKAGYSFDHSKKFDIIIEYFIRKKEYDIVKVINPTLFEYNQKMLGSY